MNSAFSLTWSSAWAAMQIYWSKRKFLPKKNCLNSQRICLEHQHGRRFIILVHQYGRHDVLRKRSILARILSVWNLCSANVRESASLFNFLRKKIRIEWVRIESGVQYLQSTCTYTPTVIEDLLLTLQRIKVSSQCLPLITIFRSLTLSVLSVLTLITIVSSARSDKEYNVV